VFLAEGLSDFSLPGDEDGRIEIVAWPLGELEGLISITQDAKTLAGLLLLQQRL
jgi:hypothetical protein